MRWARRDPRRNACATGVFETLQAKRGNDRLALEGVGGDFSGHFARLNRPADAFAQQRRGLPRRVAHAENPIAREGRGEAFGRDQVRVMLHRLRAAQIDTEAARMAMKRSR